MARFCINPGLAHKIAVLKAMQYLPQTKELRIAYDGQGSGLNLEAYTDTDSGTCLDTRRSVSGTVVMLEKRALKLHSRMQAMTASGTSEVEYVALAEAVKEVILLRWVQDFMEPSMRIAAINVFEDNEGAIKLAVNRQCSRKTKHIDVKHIWRKTRVTRGR